MCFFPPVLQEKSQAEGELCPWWSTICSVVITTNKSLHCPLWQKGMQVPQGWLCWLPPEKYLSFLWANKHRFGISEGTALCRGESVANLYPG